MTARPTGKCVAERDDHEMKKEITEDEKDGEQGRGLDLK